MYLVDCGNWLYEDEIRLWTLADAEDGDILISYDNKPFIYNGWFNDMSIGAHCGLSLNDDFIIPAKLHYWTNNINIKPATMEQRNLLFSKMTSAGYKWDSENKEMKTDQNSTDDTAVDEYKGLTDSERVLTDICRSWIGFELGWQEYIKSNARILKNTIVKQLHSVQDTPSEQEPIEVKGETELEAVEEETVDTDHKVVPKFHEGDTIVEKDFFECDCETIKEIKDGKYIFTDGSTMNINEQDGWLFVKPHTVIEQNLAKKYGITGIGSKHAQGKLGEMIKKKIETEKV